MDRRLLVWIVTGVLLLGVTGVVIATSASRSGPMFIPGDRPISEGQVRQKLQSEGYSNIQIDRQGGYFDATASKDGQTGRILVDSQTGRLAGEREEDDD